MSNQHLLKKAIDLAGGQSELGRKIGASQQRISYWLKKKKSVPAEFAPRIEIATDGEITARQLRPDVFDIAHNQSTHAA